MEMVCRKTWNIWPSWGSGLHPLLRVKVWHTSAGWEVWLHGPKRRLSILRRHRSLTFRWRKDW